MTDVAASLSLAQPVTAADVPALQSELSGLDARGLLQWALDHHGDRFALASSFGAEDVVLIDILLKLDPTARVFSLDTGRLPYETYDLVDQIRARYDVQIEVLYPRTSRVEEMTREHGLNLFYESQDLRHLCCEVRKIEPLRRVLGTVDAWATGIRRDQTKNRGSAAPVEWDEGFGILKLNPLMDWSWHDVLDYIERHDVPYNPLHDLGYLSIGCAPCTRPTEPGEDPRAGRWWWEQDQTRECGLHVAPRRVPTEEKH